MTKWDEAHALVCKRGGWCSAHQSDNWESLFGAMEQMYAEERDRAEWAIERGIIWRERCERVEDALEDVKIEVLSLADEWGKRSRAFKELGLGDTYANAESFTRSLGNRIQKGM